MEEVTDEPVGTEGQAIDGSVGEQTTEGAPEGTEGQSAVGTTDGPQEPTFFDPKTVPDDLVPAYKQMQAAYTRKMQAISKDREKIDAYNAFSADPIGQLQNYARQYGYQLTRAEAAQQLQNAQETNEDWQPQSWGEVLARARDMAKQDLVKEFGPVLQEVRKIKKTTIERELSEIDPTWQQYEDDMKRLMGMHPTLANDAALLYKMAVPEEVLQSRATQMALSKLEAKGRAARVSGGSTTTKHPKEGLPDKAVSFNEAVEAAKRKLAEEGITPLGG